MKGLLFMGLLGYAIGTLFAPKKGSELRKDIKDVVADLKESGSDMILDAQSKASDLLDKANPALDSIKEKAEQGAEQLKENAMHLKESAMQVKENAKKLKENATKSFQEGYAKEQASAKQRKLDEAKYLTLPMCQQAQQVASKHSAYVQI